MATRWIVTADWHLDAVTASVQRFDEIVLAARQVVEVAKSDPVRTVFVFAGDLTDPDPPRCWRAVAAAAEIAQHLAYHGVDQVWLTGNHDVLEDGHGSHTLMPLRSIEGCIVADEPREYTFSGGRLMALPYTARSRGYNPVAAVRSAGPVDLIVGHLMLEGIGPGSETTDFARGRDVFFPVAQAAATGAVLVNGHYHRRQTYQGVEIPGSLARLTRADVANNPGFLEVIR